MLRKGSSDSYVDVELGIPMFELEGIVLPNEFVSGGKGFSISDCLNDSHKRDMGLNVNLPNRVCTIQ